MNMEHLMVCYFVASRGCIVETCSLPIFFWVFVIIYGNIEYFYHRISSVNLLTPIVERVCKTFDTCMMHIRSLFRMYGDLSILNLMNWLLYSTYFSLQIYLVIPRKRSDMGYYYLFCWERCSYISCFYGTICVLSPTLIFSCTTCWSITHLWDWVSNE